MVHPIAVLNTSIVTALGFYEVSSITVDAARELVSGRDILSAVGHQATAEVLTDLLGREVPHNRIIFHQQVGQKAIVLRMCARLAEDQVLTLAAMEEIGYDLWLITRTA